MSSPRAAIPTEQLDELARQAESCGLADRDRVRRRIQALRTSARDPAGELVQVQRLLAEAQARLAARALRVPVITFPEDLPVCQKRDEVRDAIGRHQVVVICGETGSGKTTQLPKLCLEMGRGVRGLIGHTQPRRIAARSVASRIAEELGSRVGEHVGFKVRFGDHTSPDNFIKLMTDGILLAETQHDRMLTQYDTLIIDEAHERSLNIDFMLGYLRTLLPRRPDLKVIVTSATIDPERFARHFAGSGAGGAPVPAPIIMVSGRTYPVEVRYRPPASEDLDERDQQMQEAILHAVDECSAHGPGDILVFLSGEREIRETAETLQEHKFPGEKHPEILPLFARLTAEEQQKVFQTHDRRRIVLATNVAETSLTVPGIRFVIDPGYARINRYSARTRVQRLEIEAISRASADQRKGRCGRLGPGVCIRLFSERDYTARPHFTDPEIVRVNLASVILQMAALHLGKVEDFPFVEKPDGRMIKDGYETLQELGAVDERGQLTPIGRDLARLPIDPRIGRMVLAAGREGSLEEVLIIASALSIQDPRERPMAVQDQADAAHEEFVDKGSDFLTYLRLWAAWKDRKKHLSSSKLRRWCKEHFLSFVRMREWEDVHTQLADMAGDLRLHHNRQPAPPDRVHRALLTGLLANIATRADKPDRELGNYLAARGNRYGIFPGSALFGNAPPGGFKWLMAAEVVRTTKVYARTVAPVQPEWVEELGAHLLKRTHSEPRWDRPSGRVVANERVTIFGIELVAKRRVHFGAIDQSGARDIFIHHALVMGDMESRAPFLAHNLGLEDSVSEWEIRSRRNNLLADLDRRFQFYAARVPQDIVTAAAFERWRFEQSKKQPRLLFMSLEDLIAADADLPGLDQFPDTLDVGPLRLPLAYTLEPGKEDDGVTARVPLEALGQLHPDRLVWLVPGHLRERVETVLRGLGKDYRRVLPPSGQLAQQVMPLLRFGEGSFLDQLRAAILKVTTLDVPKESLAAVPLPLWMQLRMEVVGEEDRVLAAGRDLGQLRAVLAPKIKAGLLTSPNRFTRDGVKHWDFGDLPERLEVERAGVVIGAFPGILDARATVSLRLFDTFESAQAATRAGSRRLFMFEAERALRAHCAYIPGIEQMSLHYSTLGSRADLAASIQELVADRAFIGDMLPVRTEKEFAFRTTRGIERLPAAMQEVVPLVGVILQQFHQVQKALSARQPEAFGPALDDLRQQIVGLCPRGFLTSTPYTWLRHVPRYLQAVQMRLAKLQSSGGGPGAGAQRDARLAGDVLAMQRACDELRERQKALSLSGELVDEFRWHLEELRVSVFAQELRTSVPVSVKKMQEMWAAIVRG
ncbi:MAG: ATP-dependent RNA helicase HrpA [Phycisphaerales bacterium]